MKTLTTEQIRECVIYALEAFKQSWPQEVKWNFEIYDDVPDSGVQIYMGARGHKVLVYGRNGISSADCWDLIFKDIIIGGLANAYQDIVRSHRNGAFNLMGRHPFANDLPVTMEECLPTKSEMKEFMTKPDIKKPENPKT